MSQREQPKGGQIFVHVQDTNRGIDFEMRALLTADGFPPLSY